MMRQPLFRLALPILLACVGPLVSSASANSAPVPAPSDAAQEASAALPPLTRLQQLKASEASLVARHAEARRLCHQQFAVNDCLQAERLRHQAELRPLQREQEDLAAQLRRARAEAQRERVRERQQEFAASEGVRRTEDLRREVESAPSVALPPPRKSSRAVGSTALAAGSAASAPASFASAASSSISAVSASSAGRKAQARQQQSELQARQRVLQREELQRKLQAHQAQAQQRQAARTKPAAAALPVPSAAEIAGSRALAPAALAASAAAEAQRTPASR